MDRSSSHAALHDDARAILGAALRAVDAGDAVRRALSLQGASLDVAGRLPRRGADGERASQPASPGAALAVDLDAVDRIFVVAAGKAARPMVEAAEAVLGDRIAAGVAVGRPDARGSTGRTTLYAGGHPLPDPAGLMATRHILRLVADAGEHDLVLVLLSGGASAMLEQPGGRMPLVEIAAATSALLSSGAPIDAVNTVRKHLSAVKGGGLLRAIAPARCLTLAVSDVITPPGGDEAATIGSGPTAADPTTFADAGAVLSRYGLWPALSAAIGDHLRAGLAGAVPETLKPGDPLLEHADYRVVADGALAVAAAADHAARLGYRPLVLTTRLAGEAREAGAFLSAVALECAASGRPVRPPACLIAAGETTVTLRRLGGTGGRNRELALAAALALAGAGEIAVATLATDGVDGAPGGAGAIADGGTVRRAADGGRDAAAALDRHDSGPLFDALGDAVIPGPTATNVGDLAIALIAAAPGVLDAAP